VTSGVDEARVQAILLDIEGTTTSIQFVYRTLFPYAREHVGGFLRRHAGSQPVRDAVNQLHREWEADARAGADCSAWREGAEQETLNSAAAYCGWLIDQDRKSTPLKSIQGMIWEEGYRSGELRGHVYPDVRTAFERWNQQGKSINIFSSGSILAQKLIFTHTDCGDLTPLITAHFDTTTGPKKEAESYRKIAAALCKLPEEVLFLSDSVAELDAARAAGMETVLSARPENPEPGPHGHRVIRSFDEVFP
jgi:enolase-phosphatase E1